MDIDSHLTHPVIARIRAALHPIEITGGEDEICCEGQRRAAVLIPLIPREAGFTVLLTKRPETMRNHPGQISFPGGGVEAQESARDAALRETHEEVGIAPSRVKLIGRLDSFNAVSDYRVTPFVGIIDPRVTLTLQTSEVAEAFEAPLAFFMDPDNHKPREVTYKTKKLRLWDMPYDEPGGPQRNIWGMTAMMLYHLYQRAYLGQFEHPDVG